ncbi:hypothetical protein DH2020_028438 [Rehmannia glutinosa]|uniref:ER membrane protein complex subunit 10 n=1 Tax=Rehmannia glutinosa TaxID=99300 RepID=A0ABR0VRE1_REHGL
MVSPSMPLLLLSTTSFAFQSDELLLDDEEFGLEGGRSPDPAATTRPVSTQSTGRKRSLDSGSDPDSKIQFSLEHAFGDSDFTPAGTFSARLKTSSHGGQRLVEGDDFYRVRLPSNVLSPPGREYIVSSVKARCLSPKDALDEHFIIHMEGVNILAVNYGPPGSCPYPRQFKLPTKWSFKSHTVLKNSDQAPRTPIFAEEVVGEIGEGEEVKPPERTFWAKYWMYLIPLGLIVMNAMTQAMNMAEEPGTGQPGSQTQQAIAGRGLQLFDGKIIDLSWKYFVQDNSS